MTRRKNRSTHDLAAIMKLIARIGKSNYHLYLNSVRIKRTKIVTIIKEFSAIFNTNTTWHQHALENAINTRRYHKILKLEVRTLIAVSQIGIDQARVAFNYAHSTILSHIARARTSIAKALVIELVCEPEAKKFISAHLTNFEMLLIKQNQTASRKE